LNRVVGVVATAPTCGPGAVCFFLSIPRPVRLGQKEEAMFEVPYLRLDGKTALIDPYDTALRSWVVCGLLRYPGDEISILEDAVSGRDVPEYWRLDPSGQFIFRLLFDARNPKEPLFLVEFTYVFSGGMALARYRQIDSGLGRAYLHAVGEKPPEIASHPSTDHLGAKNGKPAAAIDEIAIADGLVSKGFDLEASFVRHFKGRTTSPYEDVIEAVCPGEERQWATVKTWVSRVKNALHTFDSRCALSFRTTIHDRLVIKDIAPK
jgi:hypothetical protein